MAKYEAVFHVNVETDEVEDHLDEADNSEIRNAPNQIKCFVYPWHWVYVEVEHDE